MINKILSEVAKNYATRVEGTREELNNLMHNLDAYKDSVSYGLYERENGSLYVQVIQFGEEN